ncbi:hypothetical protein C7475_1011159 [Chitinophaga sp. S165]|nr:hypothetical protein C7475_1011159 [Chitinophaga sp. S165]
MENETAFFMYRSISQRTVLETPKPRLLVRFLDLLCNIREDSKAVLDDVCRTQNHVCRTQKRVYRTQKCGDQILKLHCW